VATLGVTSGSVTPGVAVGEQVAVGDIVAKIEAMKMEASITTPVAGTVVRIALAGTAQVDGEAFALEPAQDGGGVDAPQPAAHPGPLAAGLRDARLQAGSQGQAPSA
jgi:pyruvate/2-oxoglutarate dehydrogenase complex dihydrolipoamide acyltransferase (E2) component